MSADVVDRLCSVFGTACFVAAGVILLRLAGGWLLDAWRGRRRVQVQAAAVAEARARAAAPVQPLARLCTVPGVEHCAIHDRLSCPQCHTRIWLTPYRGGEWSRAAAGQPGRETVPPLTAVACPTCGVAVAVPASATA